MGDATGARRRGNLRWALLFAGLDVAVAYLAGWLTDRVGDTGARVAWGAVALSVAVAPLALIWLLGELHLRWSPRGRLARGLVGWALAAACLALLLGCAPAGFYVLLMSLGYAFHW